MDVTALDEPRPCDSCAHVQRCAREELSCAAFSWFVYGGPRWRRAPREPTREHFAKLFNTAEQCGREPAAPRRRDPRSGLRPATLARFAELRALRGTFESVEAALHSVGLGLSYWTYIRERDASLAAHVRSLVRASSDGTLPITRGGRTRAPA